MITITGASDDLIEVDGDLSEEFGYDGHRNSSDVQGDLLGFSDGTLLRIKHDSEGTWRITRLRTGTAGFHLEQADEGDRTDVVTLDGDIAWVVHGSNFAGKRR